MKFVIGEKRGNLELVDVNRYDIRRLEHCIRQGCSFTIVPESMRYFSVDKDNCFSDIKVTKVIYHNPATIVFWSDGTKTVVKCDKNDTYDPEKGFYIACTKKLFGNDYKAGGRINKALKMAVTKGD
jgi:hypothetical protein